MKFKTIKDKMRYYCEAICKKHSVQFDDIVKGENLEQIHYQALREITWCSILTSPDMLSDYFGIKTQTLVMAQKHGIK